MLADMGLETDCDRPHNEKVLDEEVLTERYKHTIVSTEFVDAAADFSSGDAQVDPAEGFRVRYISTMA
ncbi:hypothetical protein H2248_007307 [Termitomyces sp. 'cryptogamus']|nr:hypothetical protein H2248_007307 [Termitomyces sp. 'cryptogamus']